MKTLYWIAAGTLVLGTRADAAQRIDETYGPHVATAHPQDAELEVPPVDLAERLVRLRDLSGAPVTAAVAAEGERPTLLAEFVDLVLEGSTGAARYVVLRGAGPERLNVNEVAVPAGQLRVEPRLDESGEVRFDLSTRLAPDQLGGAPVFDPELWAADPAGSSAAVDAYFASLGSGSVEPAGAPADAETGTLEAAGPRPARFLRLSELSGGTLHGDADQRLARIEALVLHPETLGVAFVVLGSGGVLDIGSEFRAVPLTALQPLRDELGRPHFRTEVPAAVLEASAPVDLEQWSEQGTKTFAKQVERALEAAQAMEPVERG